MKTGMQELIIEEYGLEKEEKKIRSKSRKRKPGKSLSIDEEGGNHRWRQIHIPIHTRKWDTATVKK